MHSDQQCYTARLSCTAQCVVLLNAWILTNISL